MHSSALRRVACGLMAGLGLLAGATTASAAKFVFDIEVFQGGGDPDFAPFSFQQTWTFVPAPHTRTPATVPPTLRQYLSFPGPTPATVTDSPATLEALTAAGYATLDAPAYASGSTTTILDNGDPQSTDFGFLLYRQQITDTPLGDGRTRHQFYSNSIGAFAGIADLAAADPRPLTAAVFADLLEQVGPLRWYESGEDTIEMPDHSYRQQSVRVYIGNATLNRAESVVPEPQTWALLIVGFGAVGATIRRRQAWLVSPEASTRNP
jgi:hypothetical protein